MASTIAAITTGTGGVVTTADSSGDLSLLSGATTVVAVTSAGVAVTGTLAASGASTFTGTGKFATTIGVGNATPSASGSGITFPATQSASSDANTLDDYEEGTWTPSWTSLTVVGTPTYSGTYVKVGKNIFCQLTIASTTTTASTANSTSFTGFPFSMSTGVGNYSTITAVNNGSVVSYGVGLVNSNIGYTPTWSATAAVVVSFSYISAN